MATTVYHDFILSAAEALPGSGGLPAAFSVQVFDSPVGQGEGPERVEVPAGLAARLDDLLARRMDADPGAQMDLGEALADLLLPPNARRMFADSLSGLPAGEGLRLRLRLADELAAIPWEFAFYQGVRGERTPSSFLALDTRLSIVREMALPFPPDPEPAAPESRRALVVMASPQGLQKLPGLPAEQAALRAALQAVPGLHVGYLPDFDAGDARRATLPALSEALTLQARTDIFHFSGHGVFQPEGSPPPGAPPRPGIGRLALEDAQGGLAALPADRLGEMLRSHGVRLVFLNACQSGARDPYALWNSLAAAVLRARIPAVVAMQAKIRDDLAAAFSATFYRALVAGFELDYAVSAGRAAIRSASGGHGVDWGVPVLYARSVGERLFQPVRDEPARAQAERELAAVPGVQVQQNIGQAFGPVIGTMQGNIGGFTVYAGGSQEEPAAPARPDLAQAAGPAPGAGGRPGAGGQACPACHSVNPPGARFCEMCGAALPRVCRHCGGVLSAVARFCPACGKPAGAAS